MSLGLLPSDVLGLILRLVSADDLWALARASKNLRGVVCLPRFRSRWTTPVRLLWCDPPRFSLTELDATNKGCDERLCSALRMYGFCLVTIPAPEYPFPMVEGAVNDLQNWQNRLLRWNSWNFFAGCSPAEQTQAHVAKSHATVMNDIGRILARLIARHLVQPHSEQALLSIVSDLPSGMDEAESVLSVQRPFQSVRGSVELGLLRLIPCPHLPSTRLQICRSSLCLGSWLTVSHFLTSNDVLVMPGRTLEALTNGYFQASSCRLKTGSHLRFSLHARRDAVLDLSKLSPQPRAEAFLHPRVLNLAAIQERAHFQNLPFREQFKIVNTAPSGLSEMIRGHMAMG
jgi:hypothetical protein